MIPMRDSPLRLALVCWCSAWLCLAGAAVLMLFWVFFSYGAPAPLPRPKPDTTVSFLLASDLHGEWGSRWKGGTYATLFHRSGTIIESGEHGALWEGRWWLDADGNLIVEEERVEPDGERHSRIFWSVVWERDKRNRIDRANLGGAIYLTGEVRSDKKDSNVNFVLKRPTKPKRGP